MWISKSVWKRIFKSWEEVHLSYKTNDKHPTRDLFPFGSRCRYSTLCLTPTSAMMFMTEELIFGGGVFVSSLFLVFFFARCSERLSRRSFSKRGAQGKKPLCWQRLASAIKPHFKWLPPAVFLAWRPLEGIARLRNVIPRTTASPRVIADDDQHKRMLPSKEAWAWRL